MRLADASLTWPCATNHLGRGRGHRVLRDVGYCTDEYRRVLTSELFPLLPAPARTRVRVLRRDAAARWPPRVPAAYRGVWQRTLLQTWPAGSGVDTTTHVRWLQTASLFGDVRVPAELKEGGAPLAGASEERVAALAAQWGFAGHTVITARAGRQRQERGKALNVRRHSPLHRGPDAGRHLPLVARD